MSNLRTSRHAVFTRIALAFACLACTSEQDLGDAGAPCELPFEGTTLDGVPVETEGKSCEELRDALADCDDAAICQTPTNSQVDDMQPSAQCGSDPDDDGHLELGCPGLDGPFRPEPALGVDCDETDPRIHEHAAEACDGVDQNCNDLIDDGLDCEIEVELKAPAQAPAADQLGPYADIGVDAEGQSYAIGLDNDRAQRVLIVDAFDADFAPRWQERFALVSFESSIEMQLAVGGDRLYVIAASREGITLPVDGADSVVQHAFVAALDLSDGAVLWVRPLEWATDAVGTNEQLRIAASEEGVFVAASYKPDAPRIANDALRIARLDRDGAIVWQREPEFAQGNEGHGDGSINALTVSGEQLFVAGSMQDERSWDGCDTSGPFVLALDLEGRCNWVEHATGLEFRALAANAFGGVIAVGRTRERSGEVGPLELWGNNHADGTDPADAFILHIDSEGETAGTATWISIEGGALPDAAWDVAIGPDQMIHVAFGFGQRVSKTQDTLPSVESLGVVKQFFWSGTERWARDTAPLLERFRGPATQLAVAPDGRVMALAAGSIAVLQP